MATIPRRVATEQDLLAMPKDGQKYELVDGEIRVSPAGDRHSAVAAHVVALLFAFVRNPGWDTSSVPTPGSASRARTCAAPTRSPPGGSRTTRCRTTSAIWRPTSR